MAELSLTMMSAHYLELEPIKMTFDPLDRTKGAFFDQANFQMFCVQQGFTTVKVKGLKEGDNSQITIPQRGPVKTIRFSGGTPRILSIQTRTASVELVRLGSTDNKEVSLPLKQHNADVLGFYWIFGNEFFLVVTISSIELYQCYPQTLSFKLTKSYSVNIIWAVYSPEENLLVACSKGGTTLLPYYFKSGSSTPISRMSKIEVELGPSRDLKSTLKERDVFIMNLYSTVYIAVVRSSLQGPGVGSEVLLHHVSMDGQSKLTHMLNVDIPGRCTLSVVDNLVVVHHQGSRTSMIYDISFGGTVTGSITKHMAVLAPLPIAPCTLYIRDKTENKTPSPRIIFNASPASIDSSILQINPEMYSSKWIFFQPDLVIDAQYGVMWHLRLNLAAISNMISDKCNIIKLLLMRTGGNDIILDVCHECLEPGRQANLSILGAMFDQLNLAYKSLGGAAANLAPGRVYRNAIGQREIYTKVFMAFQDHSEMSYRYMVAVVIEYIRSLNKFGITVEHFLFELVMTLLIENKCFYQLHQFLQYHVISDSKPLAMLLLSKEMIYPPATQLAMDMFKRLGTADSEIIDILVSRGLILSALRFVKSSDKVDTISARQILEAAANEGDKTLFYTVFRFFEERNERLRKKKEFPPDEQCQKFVDMFNEWFRENVPEDS